MEKLIEDLITRLQNSKEEIMDKLENDSSSPDMKMTLILSGKLYAYEQCIHELQHIMKYYNECLLRQDFDRRAAI